MMKGRRERIEKGSREGIEKRERQFEEDGLRAPVSSSPQGMTSWSSSIKFIECIIQKMSWCEKICAIGETECNET